MILGVQFRLYRCIQQCLRGLCRKPVNQKTSIFSSTFSGFRHPLSVLAQVSLMFGKAEPGAQGRERDQFGCARGQGVAVNGDRVLAQKPKESFQAP